MLIVPDTEQFVIPQTRDGNIWLELDEEIELYCTDGFSNSGDFGGINTLFIRCSDENKFIALESTYEFNQFNCTRYPYHIARRTGNTCNYGNAIEIEIGFIVDNDRFLHLMDICHDELIESNLYAKHAMIPSNYGYQHSFPRPSFIRGDFFGDKNVDGLYTKVSQMETFRHILGDEIVEKIFDDSRDIFLARGHLAAKVDFIYGSQQRGTFYFINVAPQWQIFNGGNWERVESGTRSYVADRNLYVEIYTGTHDVLQMKDLHGNYQYLYLYFDENGNGQIPVPKFYYKLIFERSTGRGIVIIGVNNPHATPEEIQNDYIICRDISHLVTWINWDKDYILRGYSYACEVNEFLSVVGHLPDDIRATGVLF